MTTTIEKRKRVITDELAGVKRLLDLYPTGILSMVSDTYDLWRMCTEYLPKLKKEILARDGKLVIRPDSGDPVDIICGTFEREEVTDSLIAKTPGLFSRTEERVKNSPQEKGVIELLWDTFGGKINKHGFKELDSHIGAIYGDSITLDRADQICKRLQAKGFASTNIVFGIGSYTYQYNTRDTFGFAMKATYGEVEENFLATSESTEWGVRSVGREIFKAPITDDGTKKSAKGLLQVYETSTGYKLKDQCTWEEERQGALSTVFINGQLIRSTTLEDVKKRLKV